MNQIFTSFNESYRRYGAACIASLFKNTSSDFEIVVLDTGIKDKTRRLFHQWAHKKSRVLRFIPITNESYLDFKDDYLPLPSDIQYYPRILAPFFSRKESKKILYIDADIICLRDLSEVFKINLNDKILGAVQDAFYKTFFEGVSNYSSLNFSNDTPYFNSGVLLINKEKWMLNRITQKVLATSYIYRDCITCWDQYALNIELVNNWAHLPLEWNTMNDANDFNTVFKHFAGAIKPLSIYSKPQDKNIFFSFLKDTPFYNHWFTMTKIRLFIRKLSIKLKYNFGQYIY